MNVFEILSTKYEDEWLQGKISFKEENDGNGIVIDKWDMEIPRPTHEEIMSYESETLPIFTINQAKSAILILVERLINDVAMRKNYSSDLSCASYISSSNPQWKTEAETFVAWRDAVWLYCIDEFDKARNGTRFIVSPDEFITEIPLINW